MGKKNNRLIIKRVSCERPQRVYANEANRTPRCSENNQEKSKILR